MQDATPRQCGLSSELLASSVVVSLTATALLYRWFSIFRPTRKIVIVGWNFSLLCKLTMPQRMRRSESGGPSSSPDDTAAKDTVTATERRRRAGDPPGVRRTDPRAAAAPAAAGAAPLKTRYGHL